MLEVSALWVKLGIPNDLIIHSDKGIKFGSTDGELLDFTVKVDHLYTLGIDEVTDLGCFAEFL